MPWLRVGDTAANHPIVLSVLEYHEIDDRLVNEVFGFVMRCALQSTAHLTDYVVNQGTALAIAGFSRATVLLAAAIHAGYLTEEERDLDDGRGSRLVYKIVEDVEFIHMRTKEEIEWERQRKLDNADPSLIIPVRLRDGDACRYCGLVVNWVDRKGRIGGTYDHRIPGKRSRGMQDTVVACRSCNGKRTDNPDAEKILPLLSVPRKPYFSKSTADWIAGNDWAQRNGYKAPIPAKQSIRPGHTSGNGPDLTQGNGGSTPGPSIPSDGSTTSGSTPKATEATYPAFLASNGITGSPSKGNGSTSSGPAMSDGGSTPGSHSRGNGVSGPPQAAPAAAPGSPPAPGKASNGKEENARPAAPNSYLQIPVDPADRRSAGSGNAGKGRDGSGRAGQGAQPRAHHASPSKRRSRPRNRKPST